MLQWNQAGLRPGVVRQRNRRTDGSSQRASLQSLRGVQSQRHVPAQPDDRHGRPVRHASGRWERRRGDGVDGSHLGVREDVDIPEKLGGYDVLGQLVIEKIGVRQNVLSKTENASLKLGVTKFYPPQVDINEPGNFCICGHNWNNILKRLDEMEIGEQFYIITKETKERIDYEIYDKYSCEPTDLSCLDQNQDGKKEVTLITCNPGGLTRLICKAREV